MHCWLCNSRTSIQTLFFFCKSSKTESLLFCSDCFCIAFLTKMRTLVNKICPLMPNTEKHMQEMQAIEHCRWVIQHLRLPSSFLLLSPFMIQLTHRNHKPLLTKCALQDIQRTMHTALRLNSAENSWKLLLTWSRFSEQTVSKSKIRFVLRKPRVKISPSRQSWSSGWSPIPEKDQGEGKRENKKAFLWIGTK